MRIYTLPIAAASLSVAGAICEILGAADKKTVLLAMHLFQVTELGDAAEEIAQLTIVRGIGATSGSGGTSSLTPAKLDPTDGAFSGTLERHNTTRMTAGGGSVEELARLGWNIRLEKEFIWTAEQSIIPAPFVYGANRLEVGFITAPVDSLDVGGTFWIGQEG